MQDLIEGITVLVWNIQARSLAPPQKGMPENAAFV